MVWEIDRIINRYFRILGIRKTIAGGAGPIFTTEEQHGAFEWKCHHCKSSLKNKTQLYRYQTNANCNSLPRYLNLPNLRYRISTTVISLLTINFLFRHLTTDSPHIATIHIGKHVTSLINQQINHIPSLFAFHDRFPLANSGVSSLFGNKSTAELQCKV